MFGRQLIIGRVLLVLAFAAAGVIASPVSPAAAHDDTIRAERCYQMSASRLDNGGARGEASGVMTTSPPSATAVDCTRVARSLLAEIFGEPAWFYGDVRALLFPAGTFRGELTR